ncbi:PLP-dependent aminotransferase family protein [Kibdelosporangium phytohabitans]|uniref:GntR family transcriptional regulator n=1 Tax=Kibdelosporangium phytohabitans TaxID=860235 RepID=A0A0N7F2R9_9PSEU|nr:PLP-dependent aminotransferase family protein [Kibdelosporangium phytohabitans]ALG06599.1 GntR family transcriptional regulator [Kibdelosporangium phytohabitans]MBE1467798.1 GntR family transcriptional regulator/MocR family aminotransferase [Kibdelosporangium phytohabitans]
MAANWTTLRELLLPDGPKRGRAIESSLRDAIRDGRLQPGARLPSSRDLAGQLGVARGTITAAYTQLVAEGYLLAKHGSGTTVATVGAVETCDALEKNRQWRLDLRTGVPALSAFPRAEWIAAQRAALADLPDEDLDYPDPAGFAPLRTELASYLGRVRAVSVTADQIVITNGAADGLRLVCEQLRMTGHTKVALEDPCHPGERELVSAHGLEPVAVPADCDGLRVSELAKTDCRAVLVTAAHQFPLGTVLHPERRRALLAWARDVDGYIIEDDYDAEHRYDRPALGAMQALDPSRVIYEGSVSKVLAPALRLGWAVIPDRLRANVIARKRITDMGCATLPQAAFALMLRSGGYDRHLRRTRALYRRRRDALLEALARRLPDWRPIGIAAGLHLVVRLPDGVDDRLLAQALAARGVNARALADYSAQPTFPGLVVGYATLTPDRLRAAVDEFAEAVRMNPS